MTRSGISRMLTATVVVGVLTAPVPVQAAAGTAAAPSLRMYPGMAPDPARGVTVLFGGVDGGDLGDTWTWDGTGWTKHTPRHSPSPRHDMGMAWDLASGQVVLFGGRDGSGDLGDTWTWNGTGTWTQHFPAHSPSPRSGMGLAHDASGQVVLFGGRDGSGDLGDTWTWNGTDWTQHFPTHSPSTRSHMGMAWDLASGQVVLFGGSNYRADTWTWDGTDWMKRAVTDRPSPRTSMGMAYDLIGRRVVLFGGHPHGDCGLGCNYWSDTWTWDGSMWMQLHPRHYPAPLCCMGISSRPRVVIFGGFYHTASEGSAVSDSTWTWDGTDWHLRRG